VPLDIFLMLDSSGSMSDKTGANGSGPSKWSAITSALATFFSDPSSAGVGVGVQHFPLLAAGVPSSCSANTDCPSESGPCLLGTCAHSQGISPCADDSDCNGNRCIALGQCGDSYCAPVGFTCPDNGLVCTQLTSSVCVNGDSCSVTDYATPAVEISVLNGAASALNAAIAQWTPSGNTPTSAALGGAIEHAKSWATDHSNHTVVVLFATDGLPTDCSVQDIPSIAQIAATAVSGSPSIKTFVIGVFAPSDIQAGAPSNLDQIASGGGTQQAFIVDMSQSDVESTFLSALNSVRETKLACQYLVPDPNGNGALDFSQVNVEFTPSGSGAETTIGYVDSAAACDPTRGGWYYDVPPSEGTPQKIIMCPATCNLLEGDSSGSVGIRIGCATVVLPPVH
jgi:hypothetical protein